MTEAAAKSDHCVTVGIAFQPAFIAALDDWAREVGGTRSGVLRRLAERGFADLIGHNPAKRERYQGLFESNLRPLRPRGRDKRARRITPAWEVRGASRNNADVHVC